MTRLIDGLPAIDREILDTLSDVDVLIEGHTETFRGIFDNPESISTLGAGGQISDSEQELTVLDDSIPGISRRDRLTLTFKDQSYQAYHVVNVEPDGTGVTRLTLSIASAAEQIPPDIQY